MTPDTQKQPWLKLSLSLMQTACSCFHHPSHLGACTVKHIGKLTQLEKRERERWMGAETKSTAEANTVTNYFLSSNHSRAIFHVTFRCCVRYCQATQCISLHKHLQFLH